MTHIPSTCKATLSPRSSVLLWSSLVLRVVVVCIFATCIFSGLFLASSEPLLEEQSKHGGEKCWIFTHLQKSGGSTIRIILRNGLGYHPTIFDTDQWRQGQSSTTQFANKMAEQKKIVAGGYTEALRSSTTTPRDKGRNCNFFTIFRHPVSRLVSAYFYCRGRPSDHLCATEILRASDVDFLTFAKHWSNFGLRQFALSFLSADDVFA